ncbi:MAG: hybrid sensor histidine kinase/response regulator [Anaerolineae bacterium]|nr:hybrid sensor histidine kinase/response regulator [Anaerolineae bacterium]
MVKVQNTDIYILVVDDTQTNREVMARILARRKYQNKLVANGEEALAAVAERLPDLILLDISMPGMDGFEVCERLKADERTRHIPVMFISAHDATEDKLRAFHVGGVDYITKPFKIEEVLARVETQVTLAIQRKSIIELSELKDQLLRTVSHDLKNPLHVIMGYSSLLMEGGYVTKPEDLTMMSRAIFNSAERMYTLVTNLLELSQIEDGAQLQMMPLSLTQLCADMMPEFELNAQAKHQTFTFQAPLDAVNVMGDTMRLGQVLSNLVSNAIKYTPENGHVFVTIQKNATDVQVCVQDNGLGIPPEAIPQLFDKFFRVNTTKHRSVEGTGLGLSIVKAIIEQHNGKIWVESELGVGSKFIFSLPIMAS